MYVFHSIQEKYIETEVSLIKKASVSLSWIISFWNSDLDVICNTFLHFIQKLNCHPTD